MQGKASCQDFSKVSGSEQSLSSLGEHPENVLKQKDPLNIDDTGDRYEGDLQEYAAGIGL